MTLNMGAALKSGRVEPRPASDNLHRLIRASQKIDELENRKATCWEMARVFLDNKDAHGIHDMGVEVQALDRAIIELRAVLT